MIEIPALTDLEITPPLSLEARYLESRPFALCFKEGLYQFVREKVPQLVPFVFRLVDIGYFCEGEVIEGENLKDCFRFAQQEDHRFFLEIFEKLRLIYSIHENCEKVFGGDAITVLYILIQKGASTEILKKIGFCLPGIYDPTHGRCRGCFDFVRLLTEDMVFLAEIVNLILKDQAGSMDSLNIGMKTQKELYALPELYEFPPVFPKVPLNAFNDHSCVVPFAQGCPLNGACTFCTNELKEAHFEVLSLPDFIKRLYRIRWEMNDWTRSGITKIFLTGADILAVSFEELRMALRLVANIFPNCMKIEGFAHVSNVLKTGASNLYTLKYEGLRTLYVGGETGDDDLLRLTHKGQTRKEIIRACRLAQKQGIRVSLFVMPGLAGVEGSERHVKETVTLFEEAQPAYGNVLALTRAPTRHELALQGSIPSNRLMTLEEIGVEMEQMRELLTQSEVLKGSGIRIEAYSSEYVAAVAENPVTFRLDF